MIYLHTRVHLKPIQLYYQLFYRLKRIFFFSVKKSEVFHTTNKLKWIDFIYNPESYHSNKTFIFLNIKKTFNQSINWNFDPNDKLDKLWIYNLNYFDFLNQEKINKNDGLELIYDFIKNYDNLKYGMDAYPTSLRIINWIKFISKHNINDSVILQSIKNDSDNLYKNLEYHLLANHLLENGFALLFAGYLFDNEKYIMKSIDILKNQLNEQILSDSGHFELSPMYHQIIFFRLLDSINLLKQNNNLFDYGLISYFSDKCKMMYSWLFNITYRNGNIPMLNDSTYGIAPESSKLFDYAKT